MPATKKWLTWTYSRMLLASWFIIALKRMVYLFTILSSYANGQFIFLYLDSSIQQVTISKLKSILATDKAYPLNLFIFHGDHAISVTVYTITFSDVQNLGSNAQTNSFRIGRGKSFLSTFFRILIEFHCEWHDLE